MRVSIVSHKLSRELEKAVNEALESPPNGHFVQDIQFHSKTYSDGYSYVMIVWGEFPVT